MLKPTDPGERRHAIKIYVRTPASPPQYDTAGPVLVRTLVRSTWAKIVPNRATDVIKSGQATAQTFLVLNIRYTSGIQANMEVDGNNGTYLIQGIENVEERNQELNLICIALGSINQ